MATVRHVEVKAARKIKPRYCTFCAWCARGWRRNLLNGIGIDFEPIKIVFFCGCFQNIQHLINHFTLVEFHLEIYDHTATPKKQKEDRTLPVNNLESQEWH